MRKKVALVLGSGGARGLAHIGVIAALEARGYSIASIAGCSMGALVGGIYAAGRLPAFTDWMLGLGQWDVLNLLDFTFSSQGLIKGDKVFNRIREFIGEGNIEALPIPFCCVATDYMYQREVVFRQGPLVHAIRASVAIPTVLTPEPHDNIMLVDGGLLNPIPVNHIATQGTDLTVVVNLNAKPGMPQEEDEGVAQPAEAQHKQAHASFLSKWTNFLKKEKKQEADMSYLSLLNRSFDLTQDRLAELMLEKAQPDVVVQIARNACGTMEFHRAAEMIALGHAALSEALPE